MKLYPEAQLPYPYSADLVTKTRREDLTNFLGDEFSQLELSQNTWSDGMIRLTLTAHNRNNTRSQNIVLVEGPEEEFEAL